MFHRYIFVLVLFLVSANQGFSLESQSIRGRQIIERAVEVRKVKEATAFEKQAVAGQFDNQTAFANPQFAIGYGRVSNDLGLKADYEEFSVSQSFSISGEKNRLSEQKDLAVELSQMQGENYGLQVASHALLVAYQYQVQLDLKGHVEERAKRLQKVKGFLNSRKFPSPQQKIELQLIHNKLQSIAIEVENINNQMHRSEAILKSFLQFESLAKVEVSWLSPQKISKAVNGALSETSIQGKAIKNEIAQLEKKYDAEKMSWVPDLNFYYSQSKEKYVGGNFNRTLGVGIEVPLFNQGLSRKRSVLAEKNKKTIELQRVKSTQEIEKEKILSQIFSSSTVLQHYSETFVAENEKRLLQATREFDKGLIRVNQFLDLEEQSHQIHAQRMQAFLNLHQSFFSYLINWGQFDDLKGMY